MDGLNGGHSHHAEAGAELPPSKLGTKEHWDEVYEREVKVFEDMGDEGEVWFGESSVQKMRSWASKHIPPSRRPIRVLECGSGNGTLLLSFLTGPSTSAPQPFHLTGIDYSPAAKDLAAGIYKTRKANIDEELQDDEVVNPVDVEWRTEDLLRKDFRGETWDLVLDKGTFDALALSDSPLLESGGRLPSSVYPERISRLVKKGGFFLITSCNFTEEEIKRRWTADHLGFAYHSSVPHKSFSFGGKSGNTICTVAFLKTEDQPPPSSISTPISTPAVTPPLRAEGARPNGVSRSGSLTREDELYICIDCGGTKTDVAIANYEGLVARAMGGTGNMAEVGLQIAYEIIAQTVLDAIGRLPPRYKPKKMRNAEINGVLRCPVHFTDIWVGISGCDTQLDQDRMRELLNPFFNVPFVPILNDAHLLGGALLSNQAKWGIAVIAGTGSVVIALELGESGLVHQIGRRGGMGYILGDDGSAFDLGRSAVRFAIDDYDAGVEPASGGLAAAIREHFGVKDTSEVLAKVHELDPKLSPIDATNCRKLQLSQLSRPILKTFTQTPPDPLAARAINLSTNNLVSSIVSLVRQLERGKPSTPNGTMVNGNGDANGVAVAHEEPLDGLDQAPKKVEEGAFIMGGGVIRQPAYRDVVLAKLKEQGIVFGKTATVEDVAGEGALGLAAKAAARW